MAVKQLTDIQDRLINSLKSLQKGEWWDTMQSMQNYPFMRVAMSMGKERSGNKLSWRIGVGSENEDGHSGLYEDYDLDRPDVMTEASLDWRHHRKGFAIDEREIDPLGDPESLVDDMAVLRNNMWAHVADDIETGAMQCPSASDKLMPHGIPYFVAWSSTALGSFHSGMPGGLAAGNVAGIDPLVQTSWRNYANTYTNYTRDDMSFKIADAIMMTAWDPPMKVQGETKVTHAIYMDKTTYQNHALIAANQNDQVGPDTAPYLRTASIARVSPTWTRILDLSAAASSNPIYIINHAYLYPCFKKGWKFREEPPRVAAKQPTAIEVTCWTSYNWQCVLRNRQAVIAKAAPFGES